MAQEPVLAAFVLVADQDHWLASPAQLLGDVQIGGGQARLGVADKADHVGLPERHPSLSLGVGRKVAVGTALDDSLQPRGVDHGECPAAPLHIAVDPVSGQPWLVGDDRSTLSGQAVEQGRLADVGTPHQGDDS